MPGLEGLAAGVAQGIATALLDKATQPDLVVVQEARNEVLDSVLADDETKLLELGVSRKPGSAGGDAAGGVRGR